ncbi:hypothetical protein DSL72_005927 [Monilinia vaccinii-corymbosi]|uniref:Uncharacterized protein n=1 Tax=Monilinia vaccinii-corymbosi TaxID=61207 RepID=A0A8A3PH75_9HELO|nr:hypothetical protein DSL72_005927 [Monilinia vaccinii-corymbosi]
MIGLSDLPRSQGHSRENLLPAMLENRPHTGRVVIMKRRFIRKMPSPIRTNLAGLHGRTSTKIRQIISEPFDVVKVVDGKPEILHRQLIMGQREPPTLLSSNPLSVSELSAFKERFPVTSPILRPRPASTPSHPVTAQKSAASELEATAVAPRPETASPMLCLQDSSPPRLTIMIPELTITTVDGNITSFSKQPDLTIKPPSNSSRAAQATLNETYAWKSHADNARSCNAVLSQRVRQLEEEMQAFRAAASQQKVFAEHFKMLFEKVSKQVEKLEKELERAVERAATAEASASRSRIPKRPLSHDTAKSTESWSHSDEAKFHAVSSPPSPTVSMIPSPSSPSLFSTEPDYRKGWVTAAQILDGPEPDDQPDPEDTENSQPGPESLALIEIPASATRTPSTDSVNRIIFNHNVHARIRNRPPVFRIPISPVQNTIVFDWCPSLSTWEWCSVPDLTLGDFVENEKKIKKRFGRVFQGAELVSLKLGAGGSF